MKLRRREGEEDGQGEKGEKKIDGGEEERWRGERSREGVGGGGREKRKRGSKEGREEGDILITFFVVVFRNLLFLTFFIGGVTINKAQTLCLVCMYMHTCNNRVC